ALLFHYQIKPLGDELPLETKPVGIVVYPAGKIDLLVRLIGENDIVGRARIDKYLAVAIEDRSARRRNRDQADALVFGFLTVIGAFYDLQVIEPNAQSGQKQKSHDLNRRDPGCKILNVIV